MTRSFEPFPGPITLDNLDELFAHHAARFPGVRMADDGDEEEVEVDDGDNEDEDDDENEADPDEGKTPEELAAELKKTREALAKANAEAKKRRLAARDKPPAKKAAPGKPKPKADDSDEDDDDAEEREAATEKKWKARVVKQAAKAALATAGAGKPERLLRLVEVDDLDVDDDGEVDGLDDEIDRLKEEYPELFSKRRGGRLETGDRSNDKTSSRPKTATEKQAAAILGRK